MRCSTGLARGGGAAAAAAVPPLLPGSCAVLLLLLLLLPCRGCWSAWLAVHRRSASSNAAQGSLPSGSSRAER